MIAAFARRRPAALIALLLAGGLGGGCRPGHDRSLLFVSIDTLRADRLGAYGYAGARTPNIDALAERGFLFRRHLTPVPITLPSHATMMTGLTPPAHGVRDNGTFVVSSDSTTLAEILSARGWATAAFVGSFPLDSRFGLDQGFSVYDDRFVRRERDAFFDERPAGAVVDAAIEHHRQQPRGERFFTFLHFFDPHQPQLPPAPFDLELRDRPYDGEIAYVDRELGRFLAFLDSRDELDSTLVLVTADHGEGLGEHGELTHAVLLHQATLHVPLILAGPGVATGETSSWSSSTQLFDTVAELLGLEPQPAGRSPRGGSLLPLVRDGGRAASRDAEFTAYFETIAPRTTIGASQLTAWMRGDWRYVHGPLSELYDLGSDPRELADRLAPAAGADPAASSRAREHLRELAAFLRRTEAAKVSDTHREADAETLRKLEALGYIQSSGSALEHLDDMLDVAALPDPRQRVLDISLYSEAKGAMAQHRWALAEGLWTQLIARNPRNESAHRGRAMVYATTGQWERAISTLAEAIALHPEATTLRRTRGELLIEMGRDEEGLAELLRLPRGSVESETWIGRALARLGRAPEARAAYEAGLALEPANVWLRLYLANSLAADGEVTRAEALYRELASEEPYFALGLFNYGVLLLRENRPELALPLFERSLRLSPQHEPSRRALELTRARLDDEARS